jgi:hypothetical protein
LGFAANRESWFRLHDKGKSEEIEGFLLERARSGMAREPPGEVGTALSSRVDLLSSPSSLASL